MAGGNWTVQNKVRPGAYVNFKSSGASLAVLADRGIVALPLALKWGEANSMMYVDMKTDFYKIFGFDLLSPELLLVKEALKCASRVIVYRLNDGVKASITSDNLTVTAVHGGSRGNDISVKIAANVDIADSFIVTTFLAGNEVDIQLATVVADLKANDYVVFSGSGDLTAIAGTVLEGGSDKEVVSKDYTDYFSRLELENFNILALPVEDMTIKGATVSFVKRMRDDEGKKIQAVLADYKIADNEGIISVKNGVILADGKVIDKVKATAWVAGATAGANINESNTYKAYEDAVDTDMKYTNSQIIDALNKGEFVFVPKQDKIVVEQDINTFVSFEPTKGKEFRKNRVIRVLDEIGNVVKKTFEDYYIGKADNNENGRTLFKSDIIKYFGTLQDINAIQNFNANTDVNVIAGDEIDSIVVDVAVQPVDSMEKLYMTVSLK